jgi:secreted PhoX family phosphatase
VYRQGYDQGAAKFNRLEGIWWDGADSIFFASTSGGDVKNGDVNADGYRAGYGQIWQYRVNGTAEELGFARDGRVFELAINILNSGELAGATFSPDGRTLFFNMLGSGSGSVRPYTGVEGMTFALTGPWEKGPL